MRRLIVSLALAAALVAPSATLAQASPAASGGSVIASQTKHKCTRTSSGKCIKRGGFCPKAKKGHYGWDAHGTKLKCKGGSHPHWRLP